MKEEEIIRWIFHQSINWEYWFIEIPWHEEQIFVFWDNKNGSLDQDEVEAKIVIYRWRKEAIIQKIIKRSDRVIIWEFKANKKWDFWFVKPFNPSLKQNIFIPWKYIKDVKDKDIVAIKITKWEWKSPEWKILEVLWDKNNPESIINGYILEAWFKLNFPRKVQQEMKELKEPTKQDFEKRKDFKKLFTFTIDGEDSKDLDDAISVEKQENNHYTLYVHIADVAHYVKNGSITQQEALKRWTSVYLPHKVLPMLPEKLSNNLCSLNPDNIKLTLTCKIELNEKWEVIDYNVYESVIESNYRLTYKEVDDINKWVLKENDKLYLSKKIISKELVEKLNIADELRKTVWKIKKEQGLLWFEFPETKIIVDKNLQVIDFKKYPVYESNRLIEEFMILANESVSRKFYKYPFLYRIHAKPSIEDIEKLKKLLSIFWVYFNFVNHNTKEYWELIEKIKEHKWRYILEKLILRTLKKAEYSDKNLGHFWLGLSYYSHFTSPIRRYPDYQIHHIIKLKKQGKLNKKIIMALKKKLENIWKKCTEQEIKAQKLEWKVRDYFMVQYYKDKIWEEFEWIISWMINSWVFVELESTAEWFIELVSKDKNNWRVQDVEILEFYNEKTWKKISIWDKVKVKLKEVDEQLLRINFELIKKY